MLTGGKNLILLGTLGAALWASATGADADIRKRFIVTDCQSRQPVVGAQITAINAVVSAGSASQAVTGPEGFAEIFPLRLEGTHQFQITAAGYHMKMTPPAFYKANTTDQTSVCLDRQETTQTASRSGAAPSVAEDSGSSFAQQSEPAGQTAEVETASAQNGEAPEAPGAEETPSRPPLPSSETFRRGAENRAKALLGSSLPAVPHGSSAGEDDDGGTDNVIHQVALLLQNERMEEHGENQGLPPLRKSASKGAAGKKYLLHGLLATAKEGDGDGDDPRDTPPPQKYGEEIDAEGITIQVQFFTAHYKKRSRLKFKPKWVKAVNWWVGRINKNCENLQIDGVRVLEDDTTALNRTPEELEALEQEERGGRRMMGRRIRRRNNAGNWPAKAHGLFHFATQARYIDRGTPRRNWLVGQGPLVGRIGKNPSPRTFNIGLFRFVKVTPRGKDGTGAVPGIFFAPNVLAARAGAKLQSRRHEIGHMFGLEHEDGGIMQKSYAKGSSGWYGSPRYWGPHWCDKIAGHLGG